MNADIWITLGVLVAAVAVMFTDRFPIVLVLGGALAVLLFTGTIDDSTMLSGFASTAPATIAALYVVAGAAAATGSLGGIIETVMSPKRDGSPRGRDGLPRLLGTTTGLSAVMPNTPLIAVLAPRVVRWTRRTGQPASRYLMPLSFASVLGGVLTLIGTSTNLVVSDLLRSDGHRPLAMFEMTPAGLPVAVCGLAMLIFVAPRLVPVRQPAGDSMRAAARTFQVVMTVDADGPLDGVAVGESGLRDLDGVFLAAVERESRVLAAREDRQLRAEDRCVFVCDLERVMGIHDVAGLTSAEQSHVLDADRPGARLFEAVVSQQSPLVGRTMRDIGFRARYDAAVLAIHRPSGDVSGTLGRVPLRVGDVLLILSSPAFVRNWRNRSDFALVAGVDEQPPTRPRRAWVPLAALAAMVVTVTFDVLTLFEASLAAAAAVVIGGAISIGDARRAVNLNVVLTIALSISMGAAVHASGLAAQIADAVVKIGEPLGGFGQLAVVVVATMILTELLTNNGAAAMMIPIALSVAAAADADPRGYAVAVLIGASCSFLSPLGYQTNLMVFGLGGYRFGDFARVGAFLSVTTAIVATTAVWLFWL